ncbi:MAG: adenylate/guanylate cyclase domain-containing protein [Gaiellaceae bacterium]
MAVTAVERRSATLVSADAAGYSRLMAADELATIHAINLFRETGEAIAREQGGRLVDSPGDNLLFEFHDAASALQAALRFQAFVLAANEQYAPQERMQFRIGMHSGEVVVDMSRIYGSGINIAARLERLARPGGICISEDIRHQLDVTPPLEDIGPQYVKNIPHPIHAFFVDVPGQALPAPPPSSAWPAIAVLPFVTPGGDRDAEYLGDGIAEDLITTLAMWRQFPVIAGNSTFTYKGRSIDSSVVGKELGAQYLVQGSLWRFDYRIRIAVRLVDAETGLPLWADRWSTTLDDVFETGDEIAQAISVALRPELLKDMSERAMRQAPADLTAWDYALRGLWHLRRTPRADGEQAVALLERAVQLDPSSGFAHAHLAHAHYRMLQNQWTVDRAADLGAVIEHAETAVACDAMDANGYLFRSLGSSLQGKREDALTDLRRAVELNPSLPVARSLLGQFLGMAGRTEEGLRDLDYAIRLSPRDPQLWSFHAGKAVVLFVARRYEESRAASERALEIEPESATAFSTVAATSALLGDVPRARTALAEMLRLWPNLSLATLRALVASVPEPAVDQYLRGLRLAGWTPDDAS